MTESHYVELNSDEKKVAINRLNKAFYAMKQLHDWIEGDNLNHEMKESLPSLSRSYLDDVCEAIGATGEEPDQFKEMTKAFNQALNEEIEQLKLALKNSDGVNSVPSHIQNMHDAVYDWWKVDGFEYLKDFVITSGGVIRLQFCFMLERIGSSYSKTPATDELEANSKYSALKQKGFVFFEEDEENDLVDCDQNRRLLTEMIQDKFPSAMITVFKNHGILNNSPNKGKFRIRGVETVIYDVKDIQNLINPEHSQT